MAVCFLFIPSVFSHLSLFLCFPLNYFLIHFLFLVDLYLFISFVCFYGCFRVYSIYLIFHGRATSFCHGQQASQELVLKMKTFFFLPKDHVIASKPRSLFYDSSFQICYRLRTLSLSSTDILNTIRSVSRKGWVAKCPVMQSRSFRCFGPLQPLLFSKHVGSVYPSLIMLLLKSRKAYSAAYLFLVVWVARCNLIFTFNIL